METKVGIYDRMAEQLGGYRVTNIRGFHYLTDGTKHVLLFGEVHVKDSDKPGFRSVYSALHNMIKSGNCPDVDVMLEHDPVQLTQATFSMSRRNFLNYAKNNNFEKIHPQPSITTIDKMRKLHTNIYEHRILLPDTCRMRFHYTDLRFLLDISLTDTISHVIDRREEKPNCKLSEYGNCIRETVKLYITGIVIPYIRRLEMIIDGFIDDHPIDILGVKVNKQLSKVGPEYREKLEKLIDSLIEESHHNIDLKDEIQNLYDTILTSYVVNIDSGDINELCDNINYAVKSLSTIGIILTDVYTLARILKQSSDPGYMKNIVVYAGDTHVSNISSNLILLGFREVVSIKSTNYSLIFPPGCV